jgi:hypothetical protein
MAQKTGVEPQALAEKIQQKAEKYSAALRFVSVLVSGLFLTLLYFRMRRYYVEHLVFRFTTIHSISSARAFSLCCSLLRPQWG